MKNESTLRISRPEIGTSQLHKDALATFPFLPEYVKLKFYALGIQLPTAPDASHTPDAVATFRYIQRCTSNGIIPYSRVKFALEEFSGKDKSARLLILPSDARQVYETKVINRDEGVQITDAMIKLRTFHELDFNLCRAVDREGRDSITAFRQQCLEAVFGQSYEIHEGILHKIGEVNGKIVDAYCVFNGAPDNIQAIIVSIKEKTDKKHAKTLSNWAQGLAGKYRGRYEVRPKSS